MFPPIDQGPLLHDHDFNTYEAVPVLYTPLRGHVYDAQEIGDDDVKKATERKMSSNSQQFCVKDCSTC